MNRFIISLVLFVMIDYIYLTSTRHLFNDMIKDIQGSEINFKFIPAIFAYISLYIGLYYFVLVNNKPIKQMVLDAAILGFVIYSVYDFTNMAIINKWDTKIGLMDVVWGPILYSSVTFLALRIEQIIKHINN
jgi:uncharacterized membrane protein